MGNLKEKIQGEVEDLKDPNHSPAWVIYDEEPGGWQGIPTDDKGNWIIPKQTKIDIPK